MNKWFVVAKQEAMLRFIYLFGGTLAKMLHHYLCVVLALPNLSVHARVLLE